MKNILVIEKDYKMSEELADILPDKIFSGISFNRKNMENNFDIIVSNIKINFIKLEKTLKKIKSKVILILIISRLGVSDINTEILSSVFNGDHIIIIVNSRKIAIKLLERPINELVDIYRKI